MSKPTTAPRSHRLLIISAVVVAHAAEVVLVGFVELAKVVLVDVGTETALITALLLGCDNVRLSLIRRNESPNNRSFRMNTGWGGRSSRVLWVCAGSNHATSLELRPFERQSVRYRNLEHRFRLPKHAQNGRWITRDQGGWRPARPRRVRTSRRTRQVPASSNGPDNEAREPWARNSSP
jgi:hypothetical protein